jgi:hypothetical protein
VRSSGKGCGLGREISLIAGHVNRTAVYLFNYITLSAEDWQEYEKLVVDARIAYTEHLEDLVRRAEALEEQSRPSE